MSIIKLSKVSKYYYNKNNISSGFSKVDLELNAGEFVVITGESGSGKSTLLNVISGLDSYEEGEMYINGEETSHYSEVDYENYRRKYIGNIFQNFNLVNSYTVYQNIELVLLLNGYKKSEIKNKVLDVIKTVGLTKYKNTKASKLSGGQKQRVAIARALIKDTPIIVADEPTGNLDIKSAQGVMKLLYEISAYKLVVIVTHNYEQVEEYATRKITMHDGKIIMDKKISKTKDINIEPALYKDIRPLNKLMLGIRNAFNIKSKFVLLCIVYFVLTLFVFSSYSSLKKISYDNSLLGFHPLFNDVSSNRVIINKKDKSIITEEDFSKINKLNNIKNIIKDDLILDTRYNVHSEYGYFYGKVRSISEINSVLDGTMPNSDDEIVLGLSEYEYYEKEIFENKFMLDDDMGNDFGKVSISGVIKFKDSYETYIYVSDKVLDKLRKGNNINYSLMTISFNDNIYIYNNDSRLYYKVLTNDKVSKGNTLYPESFNYICGETCLNKDIKINIKNIYYEDNVTLKMNDTYNEQNFNTKTGLSKDDYYSYMDTIFMNNDDYNSLFSKGTYQSTILLDDTKLSDQTINELKELGFNTYYMKDMMRETNSTLNSIMKVLRTILFVVAIIVLFFISYFIIKIVLKSRNAYFGTIRTLGATKNISSELLNIELLVDINFVYLVFIGLVILVNTNIINSPYIKDIVNYFEIKDYILIYIILIIMSLLISLRYARGLFKNSVMNAYREVI